MSNDISAFMAVGKRFSLDIKLHGLGVMRDVVQFESSEHGFNLETCLINDIVPMIVALTKKSWYLRNRIAGERLARSVDLQEYGVEVHSYLTTFILTVSNDVPE